MTDSSEPHDRVALLRQSFDASFARPFELARGTQRELLTVISGGARLAVAASELSLVETQKIVVPLPSAPPGCLGVAGVRGKLVVLYGLAELLERAGSDNSGSVLISRLNPTVGLCVGTVERYLRVDEDSLRKLEVGPDEPVFAAVWLEEQAIPVVGVDRLVRKILARVGAPHG